MATKQVEVTPEAAQRLGEPIKNAERLGESFSRICELEYRLTKTHNALAVIVRSLEDFAETDTVINMADDDSALIFGTVNLLECVAAECQRTVDKGAGA